MKTWKECVTMAFNLAEDVLADLSRFPRDETSIDTRAKLALAYVSLASLKYAMESEDGK